MIPCTGSVATITVSVADALEPSRSSSGLPQLNSRALRAECLHWVAVLGGTGFWLDNPSQQALEPSNLRVERNLAELDAAIAVPLGARENPLFGLGPGGR